MKAGYFGVPLLLRAGLVTVLSLPVHADSPRGLDGLYPVSEQQASGGRFPAAAERLGVERDRDFGFV